MIVIGGGPAGSSAAEVLSAGGHDVLLLDSNVHPGTPIRCGEAISERTMRLSGLDHQGPWIKGRIEGWRIRSRSGDEIYTSVGGFNLKRDLFDEELLRRAGESGAELELGSGAVSIVKESGLWEVRTGRSTWKGTKLVLACGPNRPLIEQVVGETNMTFMRALEVKLGIGDDSGKLMFLVTASLRGGYGWYFPRGDEVNAGVVTYGDPVRELEWVLSTLNIDRNRIRSHHGGPIPVSGMGKVRVDESAILVGDAGGFTNPVSKGGIVGALFSGKEGGQAISRSLSGDEKALESWENRMREHPAFTPMNLDRNRFLSGLSDEALDALTSLVRGRDIWTLRKAELVKEVWRRPELRRNLKGTLKLAIGGREWVTWAF